MKCTKGVLVLFALTLLPILGLQAAESPAEPPLHESAAAQDLAAYMPDALVGVELSAYLDVDLLVGPGCWVSDGEVFECEFEAAGLFLSIMAAVGTEKAMQSAYRTGQIQGIIASKILRRVAFAAVILTEGLLIRCWMDAWEGGN